MIRYRFLDLLKVVAFNLIVFHHLVFYGPMADHVKPVLPDLMAWLEGPARIAVQVFLVVGGFLAAKSLTAGGNVGRIQAMQLVVRRYIKLVPPFLVAMVAAVAASRLASLWMEHYSLTAMPTWFQLATHGLLLHGVLGVESLSAGAWYVAIDFQLYFALVMLLKLSAWMGKNGNVRQVQHALVALGVAASLFYFNCDPAWDNWAPYFFGSYGLGALAWWASQAAREGKSAMMLVGAMILLGGLALEIEFRSRIAVSLAISLALFAVYRYRQSVTGWNIPLLNYLARISYGVFLMHFPVCVLVNAVFTHWGSPSPLVQGGGMLFAWMTSILAGALFHHFIEIPLGRLIALPPRIDVKSGHRPEVVS
ncbi:acyltransferase family protein [Herbaspirillum sp. GCM10030257]|uniref:acyltransferase family protein n=1 Tax=Herbaspirillum sp. GCM10030257 TaxID=3273393 RepID=UPI003607788C